MLICCGESLLGFGWACVWGRRKVGPLKLSHKGHTATAWGPMYIISGTINSMNPWDWLLILLEILLCFVHQESLPFPFWVVSHARHPSSPDHFPSKDIQVMSDLGTQQTQQLWTQVCRYVCEHSPGAFWVMPGTVTAGSHGYCMFRCFVLFYFVLFLCAGGWV